jgi:flavin-dependent dehydrogenase
MVAHVAADPGAQLEAMLAETRLIAPLLRETPRAPAVARAAPRLRDELCRPGWIAVGDEALSLDPLCGDGTGYALREAIVAAAVVRRIDDGLPAAEALDHYRTRLQRTLAAHLRGCVAFYRDAPFAGAWETELAAMERGRRALENAVAARPEATLHLRGFELIPADAAAF